MRKFAFLSTAALSLTLLASASRADSFTVTNTGDSNNACTPADTGDGCSLREAVTAANAAESTNAHTIQFAPNVRGTITLTRGLIEVLKPTNIMGPGPRQLAISGNNASRIFIISSTVSISGLRLMNGRVVGGSGDPGQSGGYATGGAINNSGNLTLTDMVLRDNKAIGGTGGIATDASGGRGGEAQGGAILNVGTLAVNRSAFINNTAEGGTGGPGTTPSGCSGTECTNGGHQGYGNGGAIYTTGKVTLTNATISGNKATSGGGGIYNNYTNSSISLDSCTVVHNLAKTGTALYSYGGPLLTRVRNSILWSTDTYTSDVYGQGIKSEGYNLVGSTSYGVFLSPGDKVDVNSDYLKLSPLQNNGGPTPTHALLANSQAIDKGSTALPRDQRGQRRAAGGFYDIGAFERTTEGSYSLTGSVRLSNGNGVRGIAVTIVDAAGNYIGTAMTGKNGNWGYNGLAPGTYTAIPKTVDFQQTYFYHFQPGSRTFTVTNANLTVKVFTATQIPLEPSLYVTTHADENDGTSATRFGSGTSLREAIIYANSNPDHSVITFRPGMSGYMGLTSPLPELTTDITIIGPNSNTLSIERANQHSFRIFTVGNVYGPGAVNPTIEISNLNLRNGQDVETLAGTIYLSSGQLRLNRCVLTGRSDQAIWNQAGTLILDECAIIDNFRAGIYNAGTLTMSRSTISGNGGFGMQNYGTATLLNNTFSGNLAAAIVGGGDTTISSCTITQNGSVYGGGLWPAPGIKFIVRNSIVAANGEADVLGQFTSEGYNLIGMAADTTGFVHGTKHDQVGTPANPINPGLDTLQDNGGLGKTHALLPNSPALNTGNTDLTTDQRGAARPQGSADDIGAYEAIPTSTLKASSVRRF